MCRSAFSRFQFSEKYHCSLYVLTQNHINLHTITDEITYEIRPHF
ncbi:hypothetical protein HMPREF1545_00080 [Oscillibacter sp. KLE 1728]|nr:hypothetical protein HMPREF1546_02384 [Oscillibacter sp. KLE 1745]ERK65108.1 hypothetical protein HMPREF1545_00080 [Oscillibacter sp. KLE 1728]